MATNDLLSLLMGGSTATRPSQDSTPAANVNGAANKDSDVPKASQDLFSMLFDAARKEQSPRPPAASPASPQNGDPATNLLSLFMQTSTEPPRKEDTVQSAQPSVPSSSAGPASPTPTTMKPPPFTFISPFDMLEAATAKSRAPSTAQESPDTVPPASQPEAEEAAAVMPEDVPQDNEQVIELDVDARDGQQCEQLPISRFSSELKFSKGRRIACNGLISYSTRAGRIRVIDAASGARLIKKLHMGLVEDMALSGEVGGMRRLASCSSGRLSIWEVPASFEADDTASKVILDISSSPISFKSVEFSPADPDILAAVDEKGQVYLVGLRGVYEGSAVTVALSKQKKVLSGVEAISFSQDGQQLCAAGNGTATVLAVPSFQIIQQVPLPRSPSSILLLDPSTLAVASAEGALIEIFDVAHPEHAVSTLKLSRGFGSMHHLSSQQSLVISSSAGSVYLARIEGASIGTITDLSAQNQIIRSVLSGQDLYFLHPEGFDKLTLPSQQLKEEVVEDAAEEEALAHEPVSDELAQDRALPEPAPPQPAPTQQVAAQTALASAQDPSAMVQQMQALFLQQATLFETMLVNQQKAEKLRYDQTLQYISDILTNNTRKMIDASIQSAVRQEIEGRLMPEILRAFDDLTRAVDGAAQTQAFAVRQASIGTIKEELAGIGPFLEQLQGSIHEQTELIKSLTLTPQPEPEEADAELEDVFLSGLRQPDPVSILVDQAPPTRLRRTFPSNSGPLISSTNILALSVQLSRSFEAGLELSLAEKNRLAWLSACVSAFSTARHDPACANFLPRISVAVTSALSERRARLSNAKDSQDISNVILMLDGYGFV